MLLKNVKSLAKMYVKINVNNPSPVKPIFCRPKSSNNNKIAPAN